MREKSTIHYIGSIEQIQRICEVVNSCIAEAKITRKQDHVHVFHDASLDESKNIETHIAQANVQLIKCPGCELCTSPKRHSSAKYTAYPPLILLPTGTSPVDPKTKALADELLKRHPNCTHVAINRPITSEDRVRTPQIDPVVGDFGTFVSSDPDSHAMANAFWATITQNGIFQTWAPMYTMFSRGNITEKKRVLDTFDSQARIEGSTVVDLYSGIGYFTFSYARHLPRALYCWELNPWSVEGMLRAARVNKINARLVRHEETYVAQENDELVVFLEDNQNATNRIPYLDLENLSHINMGLLPHAREAIPVALELCENSSSRNPVIIHLHENVPHKELEAWKTSMSQTIGTCLHVEKIKQYSPGVAHVCGDFAFQN